MVLIMANGFDFSPKYSIPDNLYADQHDPYYNAYNAFQSTVPQALNAIGTIQKKRRDKEQVALLTKQYPELAGTVNEDNVDQIAPTIIKNVIEKKQENPVYFDSTGENYSLTPKPGYVPVTDSITKQGLFNRANSEVKTIKKIEETQKKEDTKRWDELTQRMNPYGGTRGGGNTVFRRAAIANQNAARALKLADDPNLDFQKVSSIITDMASIYRGGGVPTDVQLHEQKYNTIAEKIANMQTFLTSQPAKGKVPPELRDALKQQINEIVDVDNSIVDDHIAYQQNAYDDLIQKNPERFNRLVESAKKIKTLGQNKTFFGDQNQNIVVSNGKETYSIPSSKLKEAEADGFKRIK